MKLNEGYEQHRRHNSEARAEALQVAKFGTGDPLHVLVNAYITSRTTGYKSMA